MTTAVHVHHFVYPAPDGNVTLDGTCACGETRRALAVLPEMAGFASSPGRQARAIANGVAAQKRKRQEGKS